MSAPTPTTADGAPRPRVRRSSVILAIAFATAATLVAVDAAPRGNLHTGDTDIVAHGAKVALDCIHLGKWSECGLTQSTRSNVGPYPLLQYVPAAVLTKLTSSENDVVAGLGRVNFLAFVGAVAMVGFVTRRRIHHRVAGSLCLAVVVLSPLWYYATAGFGEMLSAVALLALALAVIERRPVPIAAAMFVAGISKETLPYFALALAVLLGTTRRDGWLPPRRVLLPAAGGAVAAVVANSVFNLFRYGTPDNPFYLQDRFRVPSAGTAIRHYLLILFSPNAGVLGFWPVLLCAAGLALAAALAARRDNSLTQQLRWLGLICWPLAFFATASLWFSPFGWIAWGPRLEVPVLAAWAIGTVLAAPPEVLDGFARLFRGGPRLVAAATVGAILALAPAASPWSFGPAIETLIEGDRSCPRMTEIAIERDESQYYRCIGHFGWRRPGSVMLRSADPPSGAAVVSQVAVAMMAVLVAVELSAAGLQWEQDSKGTAAAG